MKMKWPRRSGTTAGSRRGARTQADEVAQEPGRMGAAVNDNEQGRTA
ncbi:hypothetical protein [Longimicrobium sp.]